MRQTSASLQDVANIATTAVVEGLKESGIMSGLSREQNSDLSASVQASVADVIQDITCETNSLTKSKI